MRNVRLLPLAAILISVVAVLYPVASLFRPVFEQPLPPAEVETLWRVVAITLLQASLSVLGAFALGAPVGLLIARSITPSSRATLLSLYSMPTMVVATTVLSLLQGQTWRFSLIAVVVAHSVLNAPWIALQIAEGFRDLPRAWTEMARTLGADTRDLLRDFFIPFIRVNVLTGALQVFTLCWMSFTLVLLLGGGPPISTLETEIYSSFRGGEIQFERAAAYAIVQMFLGLVPVLLWVWFSRAKAKWASALRLSEGEVKGGGYPWMAWVLFLPYLFFVKNAVSLPADTWKSVLGSPEFHSALGWSALLALLTGGITLTLGVVFAWAGRDSAAVRVLANLPSGLSTLVLCAGFFFAYSEWLESGLILIAVVQSVTLLPIAFRWIQPRFALEDRARMDAARTLGAGPARSFFDVELWKWRKVFYRVFGLSAVWSLGEYSVIAFFGGAGERELLPQYIARLYSRYAFDEAQVAAFALFVFTWAVLRFILSRGGRFDVG